MTGSMQARLRPIAVTLTARVGTYGGLAAGDGLIIDGLGVSEGRTPKVGLTETGDVVTTDTGGLAFVQEATSRMTRIPAALMLHLNGHSGISVMRKRAGQGVGGRSASRQPIPDYPELPTAPG
jgi:hypothetical protein